MSFEWHLPSPASSSTRAKYVEPELVRSRIKPPVLRHWSIFIDIQRYSSSQSSHVCLSGRLAVWQPSLGPAPTLWDKRAKHLGVEHKRSTSAAQAQQCLETCDQKHRFSKPWSSNRLKMWQHHVQKISCSKKHVNPICVKCTSSVPCASKFLSSYSHLATEGCPLRLSSSSSTPQTPPSSPSSPSSSPSSSSSWSPSSSAIILVRTMAACNRWRLPAARHDQSRRHAQDLSDAQGNTTETQPRSTNTTAPTPPTRRHQDTTKTPWTPYVSMEAAETPPRHHQDTTNWPPRHHEGNETPSKEHKADTFQTPPRDYQDITETPPRPLPRHPQDTAQAGSQEPGAHLPLQLTTPSYRYWGITLIIFC